CLLVSKHSAGLIVPMALMLVIARLAYGMPLPVVAFLRELRSRLAQLLALTIAAIISAAIATTVIWAFHGFRYAACSPATPSGAWEKPWEAVFEKPAPQAAFDQLGLTSEQRERVTAIFSQQGADERLWSFAAL